MSTKDNIKPLELQGMIRLLKFAMAGISAEIKSRQENILLRERFGKDAVLFANSHRPSRRNTRPIDEDLKRLDELTAFNCQVEAMLEHVEEVDSDIWAAGVKEYFKNAKL